jgi:hypothetical protein
MSRRIGSTKDEARHRRLGPRGGPFYRLPDGSILLNIARIGSSNMDQPRRPLCSIDLLCARLMKRALPASYGGLTLRRNFRS